MIYTAQTNASHYHLHCPHLPLAIYREVAAHLRQVEGVRAELLPQVSTVFEYGQSQIGGVAIEFSNPADDQARQRVDQILTYYGDRYGRWSTGEESGSPSP